MFDMVESEFIGKWSWWPKKPWQYYLAFGQPSIINLQPGWEVIYCSHVHISFEIYLHGTLQPLSWPKKSDCGHPTILLVLLKPHFVHMSYASPDSYRNTIRVAGGVSFCDTVVVTLHHDSWHAFIYDKPLEIYGTGTCFIEGCAVCILNKDTSHCHFCCWFGNRKISILHCVSKKKPGPLWYV